eukprot:3838285-Rhodomonas_salina.1
MKSAPSRRRSERVRAKGPTCHCNLSIPFIGSCGPPSCVQWRVGKEGERACTGLQNSAGTDILNPFSTLYHLGLLTVLKAEIDTSSFVRRLLAGPVCELKSLVVHPTKSKAVG